MENDDDDDDDEEEDDDDDDVKVTPLNSLLPDWTVDMHSKYFQ